VLLAPTVSDPTAAADELDGAAALVLGGSSAHASGCQRGLIARAWQIAAVLLRYDAAVRSVGAHAPALLQAAQRQAEVLGSELLTAEGRPDPPRPHRIPHCRGGSS
jgi:hypothetical protein